MRSGYRTLLVRIRLDAIACSPMHLGPREKMCMHGSSLHRLYLIWSV